jgi:hypothetical protein
LCKEGTGDNRAAYTEKQFVLVVWLWCLYRSVVGRFFVVCKWQTKDGRVKGTRWPEEVPEREGTRS